MTLAELEALRKSPDFDKRKAAKASAADALLASPPVIPDREGDWIFYYACPSDGTTLNPVIPTNNVAANESSRKSPANHQCPKCKKIYRDERTVAAYRCSLHYAAERAVLALGEAYAYTGDDKYAVGAKRVLLTYADDYPKYPKRRDRWGRNGWLAPLGGRRYAQSLDEAVGVIKLAKAYDLTRCSPGWSEAERAHVEKNLFRTVAETLLWFNQGINNHQTWYNAGLMCIASVLGDEALVRKVLTMSGGFEFQIERSVTSDGLWYEGAMAYHHYALQAMIEIVEAGRRMGLNLHEAPKFRAMIEAPLKYAYPNGQFPAINDSDLSNIDGFREKFLWAWKTYGEETFAQACARGDTAKLRELLGEKAVPSPSLVMESAHLAGAGLVALRRGAGENVACVFVDYGEHGGGHGHPDKLNICLYAVGREWVLDPGRLTYSHPEHKTWCKQTVAHNTVALDGQSQAATTGRCLWFRNETEYAACAVESDGAYPGRTLRRYLWLNDKMLVDVFEVESSSPHQVDWVVHAIADELTPVGEPGKAEPASPGNQNGYQHLTDARRWNAKGNTVWDFQDKTGKTLRLWLHGSGPETLFAARGIGYHVEQKVPTLLRRRTADKTKFVTVFDLTGNGGFVKSVKWEEKSREVVVETLQGTVRAKVSQQSETSPEAGGLKR